MDELRARILDNLTAFERIEIDPTGRRRAAVAIVLAPGPKGPAYLLTRRALHLRRNAGNYALPGGGFETQFSFAQALTESAKLAKNCLLVISLPASDTAGSPHTQADDVEVGGVRGREALDRLRRKGRFAEAERPDLILLDLNLPGGGFDEGEDAVAAACRETHEEVGVDLPREAALGLLDDFLTLGGHVVTPVVLWSAAPLEPVANPEEVHVVWQVPVSDLDHPRAPRREKHPDGGPPILRMFARGGWVNPPTAAFLWQFREVCLHGRPCRTDAIGQPSLTAR